ncbi:protein NUCLEAR FUSION DEFECTIVE 6, chloroplastic/mitochondrial isoform X3 [Quillaja saponaria]|uniref:Protein NUCLEAR FUSION DEFECTIVE 6, chloroplastic/mitochondrial isoform X3 n=1 Tax=Quillaja saponaria TaxID=32244 RepID=A0AAD7PEB6_QUISA|nr:protein NUCLEAR FUSION DEFECTIVE 6, chloroplastic/mitochondrial isoform X3 [Quillaja saponaria]
MASTCKRFATRTSISSIKAAIKSNVRSTSFTRSATTPPFSTRSASSPMRQFFLSRSPAELGCVQSMLPLHSAVAAARMTSCLSTTSRSCRSLSQELGLSVPR